MSDSISTTVEPLVETVGVVVSHDLANPSPVTEVSLAIPGVVLVIGLHGWFLGRISRRFAKSFRKFDEHTARWRVSLLMGVTVAELASSHLIETFIWAIPLWYLGLIDTFRHAYSFTLEQYTTLGAGDVRVPQGWSLIGPMIAISGLFTFGWTGSVLVYVMGQLSNWHGRSEK